MMEDRVLVGLTKSSPSSSDKILKNGLLLLASYWIAVLAAQMMIFYKEGHYPATVCELHRGIYGSDACDLYVENLGFGRASVSYALTEASLLSAGIVGMGLLIGAIVVLNAVEYRSGRNRVASGLQTACTARR
ncbi:MULTISPECIES: hypothetical protein [Methylobacterium]|uniref:hypothetical protein n=1 Tax=Methylobacterium TaxID=407 RepID=UPI00104CD38F|nr:MULTISPECIES: hypothetical protein [Methylobacterium]MDR7040302.1 hypothetical protein [Methylobacterium sp. BE186]